MIVVSEVVGRARTAVLDQPATLGDGDCEALRPGLLGQPTNTLTSFAHVVAGAWLATRSSRLPHEQRSAALGFAALVALTGAGSVAYHGPQFPGAQAAHDAPILAALGMGAAVPLWRRAHGDEPLPGASPVRALALVATLAGAGSAYMAGRTGSRTCRPRSRWQWHGLWHLGTAATLAQWGAVLWSVDADRSPSTAGTSASDQPAGAYAEG